MKHKTRLIITVILTFVMLVSCTARPGEDGIFSFGTRRTQSSPALSPHDFSQQISDHKELNGDTVGWLYVPGTGIDDVVVCDFTDNNFYLRKNFEKEYDFNGVFYADRRSDFGSGKYSELGRNTCIYGHAMTDEPDHWNYHIKFGELHNFRDEDFARETPYIYFSTEGENLVWEVFAVFFANRNMVPFNRNDLEPDELNRVVTREVIPRSIYKYDVKIQPDDKFLTLSTCVYILPDGTDTQYPDTHYRYGIMARLVRDNEDIKDSASFTINRSPKIDPDPFPN